VLDQAESKLIHVKAEVQWLQKQMEEVKMVAELDRVRAATRA
jgi:hypothetical protein